MDKGGKVMDDLISRQAAIDALMAWEKDSFWDEECIKHRGEPYWVAPSDVIEQLPSAPLPEIIRCKDCKWSDWYTAVDGHRYCYCMETGNGGRTEDDFCSYAERETDDERPD